MKSIFFALFALLLFYGCASKKNSSQETKFLKDAPEFYSLEWNKGDKLTRKSTALKIEVDSIGKLPLSVFVNANNLPVLYMANIETPVCADGECKHLVDIRGGKKNSAVTNYNSDFLESVFWTNPTK